MIDLKDLRTRNLPERPFTLHVERGETVGLSGPNGSGKTSLLRFLAGLDADAEGKRYTGTRGALVCQHAEDNLIFSSLREDVRFGTRVRGGEFSEKDFEALRVLFRSEDRPYFQMNSDETERAAFASIYSQHPDLLLLDEPLSYGNHELLAEVLDDARNRGMTVLLASHNPQQSALTDRVIQLDGGNEDEEPIPPLCFDGAKDIPLGTLTLRAYEGAGEPVLKLKRVGGISCELRVGGFYELIGAECSEKTNLLRLMAGLTKPTSGEIRLPVRRAIGYAGPHAGRQLFMNTVIEDVMYAPKNYGLPNAEDAAEKALRRVGLCEKLWQRNPMKLSGGEQRKAALAGVIASEPRLLLLNCPYTDLDNAGIRKLNDFITEYIHTVHTVVLSGGYS